MSTGALLYAFNSDIDYVKIALECAQRVHKHLNIPVSLVTDKQVSTQQFDQQIIVEKPNSTGNRYWHKQSTTSQWFNSSRSSALDLTPYDTTLLLDADYLINTNSLQAVLESNNNFQCFADNIMLPDSNIIKEKFGKTSTPQLWATVCKFTKHSEEIFTAWQMIERNYSHYAKLFGFKTKPFRNDYALTLALLLIGGGKVSSDYIIPWTMISVGNCDFEIHNHSIEITYLKQNRLSKCTVNTDVHIINKLDLEKQLACNT